MLIPSIYVNIDLALDGDAQCEHVTTKPKDAGTGVDNIADALNQRPDDFLHGLSLTREDIYRGLVIPKSMDWSSGGILSSGIVVAPFGAVDNLVNICTRDIFAIGILRFRRHHNPLRHLREVEIAQLSKNESEMMRRETQCHPRGASS
jgi:hypothetical protein